MMNSATDSIKGLQEAAQNVKSVDGAEVASGYKLQKVTGDELKSYRYSVSQLGYAIEQELEIR